MTSLCEQRELMYIKSYIKYEYNDVEQEVYSVGKVDNNVIKFDFLLPSLISEFEWNLYSNFNFDITDIEVYDGDNKKSILLSKNDYERNYYFNAKNYSSNRVTIYCTIKVNSWGEIIYSLKNEYGSRCAHIEQLLQTERDLNNVIREKNEIIKKIEQSFSWKVITFPHRVISKFID